MEALADVLRGLGGWRKRGAALMAGVASVLAMAPFFYWPVLWITLPVLVWLLDGALRRGTNTASVRWHERPGIAAFEIGWWFGFGYFVAGLFWVGEAFLVEAEKFAVLLPLAVTLLPAGLALFYGVATALAAPFWESGPYRVLVLAITFSAMEWARGHVLTGFPWNTLGYALTYPESLMQSVTVFGIYGLTLVAVLIFGLPLVLWSEAFGSGGDRVRKMAAAGIALFPIVILAALGELRLASASPDPIAGVNVRIVQPSVPQREKWRTENQEQIFRDHLALSATAPDGTTDNMAGVTHVIWPEAAMPFLPLDYPEVGKSIGELLPSGTFLIAGALRAEPAPPGSVRARRIFNSLLVFDDGGALTTLYDKIHLVPFGEYLPFQRLLESIGLRQLTRLRGGFDRGVVPRPLLRVPGLPPAAPLICYEAIFPGAIVQGAERPGFLLNVTNDGWFGNTTGPRQHLHQARVRSVEEGLPLVRIANNGISAVVDPHGRILARLGLDERGTIDTALPAPVPAPLYARYGDGIFAALWLGCVCAAGLRLRRRRLAGNSQ
jgi:apolipoprotein N-acyltransferase